MKRMFVENSLRDYTTHAAGPAHLSGQTIVIPSLPTSYFKPPRRASVRKPKPQDTRAHLTVECSIKSFMDKSRHDKTGGHGVGVGGRLRQRLAQILLHSSCATTSVTSNAAASHQEPPPPRCAHEQRPKPIDGRSQRRRHRRRSTQALVHISIDCSACTVGAAVLPSPMPAARDIDAVTSGTGKKGDGEKARSPLYSWSLFTDTDGELAPFSSDGERGQATDTRSTLFSSHSFSSDSTVDFYTATGACARPRRHTNSPRRAPPRRSAVSRASTVSVASAETVIAVPSAIASTDRPPAR